MTLRPEAPYRTRLREARQEQRLGANAACPHCGETDPAALTRVPARLWEEHHVVGHANDEELTITVCRNWHAILHEQYRRAGVDLEQRPQSVADKIVAILYALGVFLIELGKKCMEWAKELAESPAVTTPTTTDPR